MAIDTADYDNIVNINNALIQDFFPGFLKLSEELNEIAPPLAVTNSMIVNIVKYNSDVFNTNEVRRPSNVPVATSKIAPDVTSVELIEHSHATAVDRLDLSKAGDQNGRDKLRQNAINSSANVVHFSRMQQMSEIVNDNSLFTIGVNDLVPTVKWDVPATADPRGDVLIALGLWDGISLIDRYDERFMLMISQDIADLIKTTDQYTTFTTAYQADATFAVRPIDQQLSIFFGVKVKILASKIRTGDPVNQGESLILQLFTDICILTCVDRPTTTYTISTGDQNESTFLNAVRIFERDFFNFVIPNGKTNLNVGGTYALTYAANRPDNAGQDMTVLALSSIGVNKIENLVRISSIRT